MGRLKQAIGRVAAACYAALALAILFFGLPFTGWRALSVQTGSMVPAIQPGALVIDRTVDAEDLRVGDVITYRRLDTPTTTIAHRIVDILYQGNLVSAVVVKGDANPRPDPPLRPSQIVGRVAVSIPVAGRAVDTLHTLPGLLLLIYIPALGIILYELQLLVRRLTALQVSDLMPTRQPRRALHFKPTRMVYTIRSGARGPRLIRRIGVFPIIFILFAGLAVGASGTRAALQSSALLTTNRISASRVQDQDEDDDGIQPGAQVADAANSIPVGRVR